MFPRVERVNAGRFRATSGTYKLVRKTWMRRPFSSLRMGLDGTASDPWHFLDQNEKGIAVAKSPEEMKQAMIAGLKEKTGKSLEEWLKLLRASGLAKHKEIVAHLKSEHGVTHGFANMIALQVLGSDSHTANDDQSLIDCQYSGAKTAVRPIYDAVLAAVSAFGKDVVVSPKKAYVSLRREKQFAIVQPSTSSRVDVGLVLPGVEPGDRLEESGSFNAMVTHRVRVSKVADVDEQMVRWLRQAYDLAGPKAATSSVRKPS